MATFTGKFLPDTADLELAQATTAIPSVTVIDCPQAPGSSGGGGGGPAPKTSGQIWPRGNW